MQQISTKGVKDYAWLGGDGDPLGMAQEIKIWQYYQIVYAQTRIYPRGWDT